MKRLAPKRRKFVLEYLKDYNATQAAIRAGYSARSASQTAEKMMRIGDVAEAIKKALEDDENELAKVVANFKELAYMPLDEARGKGLVAARMRALENLGKHLGMTSENVSVKGDLNVNVTWDDATDI